jgi:hypothetical protein
MVLSQVVKASTQGLPIKTAAGDVVYQPSQKQQLAASKVQVEGVLVEDSLHLEQQQRQADKLVSKQAAAAEKAAAAEQRRLQKQQQQQEGQQQAAAEEGD